MTWAIVGVGLLSYSPLVCAFPPLKSTTELSQSHQKIVTKPLVPGQKLPIGATAKIDGQTIQLEVARTSQEQVTGLMYRTALAKDRGMLFVFNPPRPVKFWMKNTLIPLDMVFISNGVVKYISANVPPCRVANCPSYGPDSQSNIDGVIELPAGRAAGLKIKVGDVLKISLIQPKG